MRKFEREKVRRLSHEIPFIIYVKLYPKRVWKNESNLNVLARKEYQKFLI